MANKISSNVTGLSYAEELSLKNLPVTPVWYGLEPNSYSDMGGEITTVAREPISQGRQRKKGTTTDLDASGGFNSDFTFTNLMRLMQGFCFANIREKPDTKSYLQPAISITAVTATQYQAAAGLGVFTANMLVRASGFSTPTNNGVKLVTASAAGSVDVAGLTAEAAPPAAARLVCVGREFAVGDVTVTVAGGGVRMDCTAGDFTTLGCIAGEWIHLGDDLAVNQLGANVGFARIDTISSKRITFSDVSFPAVTHAGASIKARILVGNVLRNEPLPANIVTRSYNIERTLGSDNDGVQAQYLIGAICNEFTLNIPTADKLNADLGFIALDNQGRTGAQGLKTGTRFAAPGEAAFNTSQNVYRMRLSMVDSTNVMNTALFAYATEASITINNNATADKAIGVLGGFDITVGNFDVGGNITAYFSTVDAVNAIRNNGDVSLSYIFSARNTGLIFDLPLVTLGNGRANVEKDQPVTLPVSTEAAESKYGHTLLMMQFNYVPFVSTPA